MSCLNCEITPLRDARIQTENCFILGICGQPDDALHVIAYSKSAILRLNANFPLNIWRKKSKYHKKNPHPTQSIPDAPRINVPQGYLLGCSHQNKEISGIKTSSFTVPWHLFYSS
ncbi:hypothetical protein Y1Q_0009958 [Alligator mississippiensis]|uniref:Uncharacterized protein n=1 Tax=Alligator mississippiensis TaxID=8496 RepID=A0A151MXF1_ALLMI|nr:hypothetical protein Y1Q_0009958 [Alligator mississippiensis]